MTDTAPVSFEIADGIAQLRLNRLEKKNAITAEMYSLLADGLQQAESDPQVRVTLIHGGDQCFTAGNDLKDFMENPAAGEESPVGRFLKGVSATQKPLVAAVAGSAIGIGTTMLLHCDFVFAAAGSTLQLPFVNLGLVPELASSYLLPRLIGHQRAAEMLLLGKPISAQTAFDYGLVNQVVPDGETLEAAMNCCRELAALPPAAVRESKALMKQSEVEPVAEAMRRELKVFAARLSSPEAKEAFTAFFERRKPDFSKFE